MACNVVGPDSNRRTSTAPRSSAPRKHRGNSQAGPLHVSGMSVTVRSPATATAGTPWLREAVLPTSHWQTAVSQGYVIGSIQATYPEEMTSPAANAASSAEAVFLANLELVDRLVALTARRHALSRVDAEEFGAWVRERLIDNEYAILRKFAGRSSLSTYLTTVVVNLFRDFRNNRWGRWRPSAEAKRRGPIAVRLEELLYRDGHPVREAVQILRSSGCGSTDSELMRLATRLPQRSPKAEVSLESPGASSVADQTEPPRDVDAMLVMEELLRSLVSALPAEDALIMRMRFWNNLSVADIARTLHTDQKPLYRRLEKTQARLREALEARGVYGAQVTELLSGGET
jgi:RNA polymerase sigma factor (sigma-70 family)